MAIDACINAAVATALLALLLVPPEYLLPRAPPVAPASGPPAAAPSAWSPAWPPAGPLPQLPAADVALAGCALLAALATYPWDWLQRKLLERRIQKMKQQVSECTELVRSNEARSRRAERSLRTARAAAAEYGLLLYLLRRRHQLGAGPQPDGDLLAHPDQTYAQKVL